MKRALFVDRDGVLNAMVYDADHGLLDSPRRPEQVRMIPGAGRFLAAARAAGWLTVVVTNQPGIAKGTLTVAELEAVHTELRRQVEAEGAGWDDLYYSPYHPKPGPGGRPEYTRASDCRKPGPGMLLAAAEKHGIDCAASWMIGDGTVDVQAGRAAGCRTILVTDLKISQIEQFHNMAGAMPDLVVKNLDAAWEAIQRGGDGKAG
jgi:D-glycero-D-manno-heptose 1,7-bisphosphate phosphatase